MTAEETKAKAPMCSKVAAEFREVFGEARLLRLKEGDVSIGRPDKSEYATCMFKGMGQPIYER